MPTDRKKRNSPAVDVKTGDLSALAKRVLAVEASPEHSGAIASDIAVISGVSLGSVEKIRATEEYKRALSDMLQTALDVIVDARKTAAKKLVKLIGSKDERVALRACENVLGPVLEEKTQPAKNRQLSVAFAKPLDQMTDEEVKLAAAEELRRVMSYPAQKA